MPSIVRAGTDFISVLEALYQPEPDTLRWAADLLVAIGGVVAAPRGLSVGALAHEDDYSNAVVMFSVASDPSLTRIIERMNAPADELAVFLRDSELVRAAFYPGRPVAAHSEVEAKLTGQARDSFRAVVESWGGRDMLSVYAYPRPGLPVILSFLFDHDFALSRTEHRVLHRVAGHLDSAFRLRYRPDLAVAAVLSPSGRFLDLADASIECPQRERLAERVLTLERTRLRDRRNDPAALGDWQALIDGRYSVVPRDDTDGKRHYLLIRNAAIGEPHARFSAREIDVLRMAARGFTGKGITYALGLPPSSVSTALASAAAKVGLRSRHALVEVASAMFGVRSSSAPAATLTPAERDVLELLRRGLTNAEIARLRERSSRTVANQVASVLHKCGAPSRRALAAARLP
ncbi:LuxR C-terminal-related transcriptional regulator [Sorangium sp. So ce367]|uniref:helix-turn-helix transcriptional regulator n=1 Tax=Sorangium sp. So ce367 TaxID=3133305 RepID=UPI003F621E63